MPNLFVVGDSISLGYEPYLAQYLPVAWEYARKTAIPGNTTFAHDDNGGDSGRMLAYIQYQLENETMFTPDVLLLNAGLHDIRLNPANQTYQVSIENYEANLRALHTLIHRHNIKPIWVTTTPVDDKVHQQQTDFARRNADVLAYTAVAVDIFSQDTVIDLYTFTLQLAKHGDIYSDHVHFIDEVQHLQAAYIAGFLQHAL